MKLGRRVLFAVLVYVTLDLSLPAMPGAFVFEPADSVESAQMNRGRAAGDVLLLPASLPSSRMLTTGCLDVIERSRPPGNARSAVPEVVSRLPRAALAPAPASEDPQ